MTEGSETARRDALLARRLDLVDAELACQRNAGKHEVAQQDRMVFDEQMDHRMRLHGDAAGGKLGPDEVLEMALQAVLALAHEAHDENQVARHQLDEIASDAIGMAGHRLG